MTNLFKYNIIEKNRSGRALKLRFKSVPRKIYFPGEIRQEVYFSMYAIIENGSKQYKVANGEIVNLEKLSANVGDKVEFNVLLVSDENGIKVAKEAAGYKAVGEVTAQAKDKKVIVYKYKAKKNERRKHGHRQPFTSVKIVEIVAK